MRIQIVTILLLASSFSALGQNSWTVCNAPAFTSRVDDIYMVNTHTGYAVCGDGKIVKTTDGGDNWTLLTQTPGIYCRSVEFINEQKGFVGGFPGPGATTNIFRRTMDGGATWTDLTALLPAKARKGICGISVADENTIYGGGNWYNDSGYVVKSIDGGNSWNLIDMNAYTNSIIDMYFTSKDTGFVTGMGKGPSRSAIILYTTDGGITWTKKFESSESSGYCWKIQRLTKLVWFASIQDLVNRPAKILRSIDGGMTWESKMVTYAPYNIQGVGFIDPKHGWAGGSNTTSWETKNGGVSWDSIAICPAMDRVFRVNDTMIFATGQQIWKYHGTGTYPVIPPSRYVWMTCHPNPVKDILTINVALSLPTRALVALYDQSGQRVKVIENADRPKGSYQYYLNTTGLQSGIYYVRLDTHEDWGTIKVVVSH